MRGRLDHHRRADPGDVATEFLVAFRPGFISPTLAAHQAATFQRISGGRLLLNIVTGGDPSNRPVSVTTSATTSDIAAPGSFLRSFAVLGPPPTARPSTWTVTTTRLPARASTTAMGSAASLLRRGIARSRGGRRTTRRHLPGVGETPRRSPTARPHPGPRGGPRTALQFGIRLQSSAGTPPPRLGRTPSGSCRDQRRTDRLRPAGARPNRIRRTTTDDRPALGPDIRLGDLPQPLGRLRPGSRWRGHRTGGKPHRSRRPLAEYHALGIDHFILSGQPHIEEAYWFAEGAGGSRERGLIYLSRQFPCPPRPSAVRSVRDPSR